MVNKAALAGFLAIAAVVVAAPARPQSAPVPRSDELFERTVPLAAGGSFALENVNGPVTITGWDRDAVEIRAVKVAPNASADLVSMESNRVQIGVAAAGNRVEVTTAYPADQTAEVTVAYSVRVPRTVWLQRVMTVNGSVHVSGMAGTGSGKWVADSDSAMSLKGAAELHSVNGNVDVFDSSGGFSARTVNGDIHVELTHLGGAGQAPVQIETINGSIDLALPADAGASLDVRCLNGAFHSDLPVTILSGYTEGGFRGRLGRGGTAVRLGTVNGAIRVRALTQRV